MSWGDPNIYYSPESFGLEPVGEVEFSDGFYQFDLLAAWRHKESGRLYYAEDSGCSCPSPFEGFGSVEELTPVADRDELRSRLEHRASKIGLSGASEDIKRDIRALLDRL